MNDSCRQIIEDLYNNNMWITDEHINKLNSFCLKDNISEEELLAIIQSAIPNIKKNFCKVFDRMGNKREYYHIGKILFKANEESVISIGCKYSHQKLCGRFVVYISEIFDYDYTIGKNNYASTIDVEAENNTISFSYCFPREDAYNINVYYSLDDKEYLFLSQTVYALNDDLAELIPLKADLHMHTTESDGYESPEMVAVSARKHGLNIIAITDHNAYSGSVKAAQFVRENGINMTVIPGEEYSLEYSPMHILALGTDEPIARKYLRNEILNCEGDNYRQFENDEISMNRDSYIATQILLSEVKRMGGISILAHPFWKPIDNKGGRMDTPEIFYRDLATHRLFDGIEIVSGSQDGECDIANLQNALATSLLGDFKDIPVIGITDSHFYSSDTIAGKHFTIVFSKENNSINVLNSLSKGLCVAVEMVNGIPMCYGNYRFVKYAQFLVKYYFPEKDIKAFVEASLTEKLIMI